MLDANLPYPASALEPVISEKTLTIHHELFEGYAAGLEKAQKDINEAKTPALMRAAGNDLAFQGSGYLLHQMYFYGMVPGGSKFPETATQTQIASRFGSFDSFKQLFTAAGMGIYGPGWAVLAYLPATRSLEIVSVMSHCNNMLSQSVPILVLDVWEHAYFLDYGRNRNAYIDAWWQLVNGQFVEAMLAGAKGDRN